MTTATILEQRLRPGTTAVTDDQIAEVEERVGHAYPPSFRDMLVKHGLFKLVGPSSQSTNFEVWPLEEHQTALERAASELECDATAEAVSGELGLAEDAVAALGQVIIVGSEGNTDFVGFDLRTLDPETHEATFVLQLMDDLEIEHLAEHPGNDQPLGFAAWLEGHARRRD